MTAAIAADGEDHTVMGVGSVGARTAADANSAKRWRILLVEDSEDDAELTRLVLADSGIDADCRCVDGEAALRQSLASFAPQLVLSDRGLPGFSGQHALELVRAHAPSVPFVFISGTPGDEAADGDTAIPGALAADGWLDKDDLAPLPALVRRLLAR